MNEADRRDVKIAALRQRLARLGPGKPVHHRGSVDAFFNRVLEGARVEVESGGGVVIKAR